MCVFLNKYFSLGLSKLSSVSSFIILHRAVIPMAVHSLNLMFGLFGVKSSH